MPGVIANGDESRKRKRDVGTGSAGGLKARKAPKQTASATDDTQAKILLLEEQILQSTKHYSNIEKLSALLSNSEKKPKGAILAAVALCRVFCRLIAAEKLAKVKNASEKEAQLALWLRARLRDYVGNLRSWIGSPDATQESTAITLLMRIAKQEASGASKSAEQCWRNKDRTFHTLVGTLLQSDDAEGGRQEFVDKFVEEHDDVRYYTFVATRQHLQDSQTPSLLVGNAIELLSQIEGVPESDEQLEDWYGDAPEEKSPLLSLNAHRKAAREAWMAVFRSQLTSDQRKKLLSISTVQIMPWFVNQLELLADFLTDSFDEGGAVSLLALNGIFYLMTQKNLDYPDFYTKLYSLLDEQVLHSKHRSRFFRLLETFMSSTHLPATMVASFIKRLSRLALQAPPGAIVWIVPWVYNQLKQHPSCTFMLHRTYHPAHEIYSTHPSFEEEGMDDPFSMSQPDPSKSGAIHSSLWELETLGNHYHPNVATLAKIIGEQFTKRDYQLEDFLNHSYASLIDAELGKEVKKTPVVEWDIPKRIVTSENGGLNSIGTLLENAFQASSA